MLPYLKGKYGNPSSLHRIGRASRDAVEEARRKVARLLGAEEEEIFFTSGGTESVNMALKGMAIPHRRGHIITSSIEHHAVLSTCRDLEDYYGFKITYLPVDRHGLVNPEFVGKAIRKSTVLVSIMHANNETGTIEPLEEISKIIKRVNVNRSEANLPRVYFHTDAVQTVGKWPVDVNILGVDMLSLSGHKFYGPKGIGALYLRTGTPLHALLHGGHHERNLRAGTENVPGIIGLGSACELAEKGGGGGKDRNLVRLKEKLRRGILKRIDEVTVNSPPDACLPGTLNVCFRYVEGESIALELDLKGVSVSSGSACSAGSPEPSHVLTAIGVEPVVARGSVRFSLGRNNKEEEVDYVLDILPPIIRRLREMSPFYYAR